VDFWLGFRMPTQIRMPTQPNATVPNRAARRVEGDDWHANPALMTVNGWMDGRKGHWKRVKGDASGK